MSICLLIVQCLYFFLPAYLANASPVLGRHFLKEFAYPIDLGKKFRGRQILGSHKTWRGVIFAVFTGSLVFYAQQLLYQYSFFQEISLINYSQATVWLGFFLGFGAIFGDAVKSFFKRRVGIKAGGRWIPFDQLDYVVGALLFGALFYVPSWHAILVIVVFSFFLHIIANHIAYYLGIKKVKW